MPAAARLWQIWVDTGGTFTDCLALSPQGRLHRAKVLSTSALRGNLVEQLGPLRFRIESPWSVPPGFFGRCTARCLGWSAGGAVPVASFDSERRELLLAAPLELPSSPWPLPFEIRSPEEAPVLAARLITGTAAGEPLPPLRMRLATTRGTNALLERQGARTALFISRGFADLPAISTQQRRDLFALAVTKPSLLHEATVEVGGRLAADGSLVEALDIAAVGAAARGLVARGVRSAAVALIHGDRHPAHEREVTQALRDAGFTHVSRSSEIAPRIGLLARAQTAIVDAYLSPIVGGYLDRVAGDIGSGGAGPAAALGAPAALHVMTSAGGLLERRSFRAKDALLSGPAGGVVGAAAAGERSAVRDLIAFDMGGTSTDVSRFGGKLEYAFEHTVGDAHIVAPALRVETVAAGGGSICDSDGRALLVGPRSAGADPGPACYGAGGPLTITDVNLLLGRLLPERFGIPIDVAAAGRAFDQVSARLLRPDRREVLLEGFLRIANERMADAIRRISVREGYDPRASVLLAFGGAGGQHACALAELLGMRRVLVPENASLLSAVGLGAARIERFAEQQVLAPLAALADLPDRLRRLGARAVADVVAQGALGAAVTVSRRIVTVRLAGQDASLQIELAHDEPTAAELARAFASAYRDVYGYAPPSRGLEIESLRVVAAAAAEQRSPQATAPEPAPDRLAPALPAVARAFFAGRWLEVAIHERSALRRGRSFDGPCLVVEEHSATAVDEHWRGQLDEAGALALERCDQSAEDPG